MLTAHFGCAHGHTWKAAVEAAISPDQEAVTLLLAQIHPVCMGCGLATTKLRIRLRE